MDAKFLLVISGILLIVINAIATLLAFNITSSFLGFLPAIPWIYSAISCAIGLCMIVLGLNTSTY